MMDVKKRSKKDKKAKKHKRAKYSSESESSSDEMEWTEAPSSNSAPKQQREEWMEDDSFVPTYDRKDLQTKSRKQQKLEETALREKKILEERELNPYWKNKGSGVPDKEEESIPKDSSHSVGDGGYSWLKKAYQRVEEQAAEEKRTMEDVAQERWGSLEKLETMLKKARDNQSERCDRSWSPNPGRHREERSERHRYRSTRQDDEARRHDYREDRSSSSRHDSSREKHHSQERRSEEKHAQRWRKSESRASRSPPSYRSKLIAPRNDEDENRSLSRDSASSYVPAWKKKSFVKEFEPPKNLTTEQIKEHLDVEPKVKSSDEDIDKSSVKESEHSTDLPSTKDTDSDGDQSGNGDDEKNKKSIEGFILNQNEMNYLGARLLQAKLEGDLDLVSRIQKDFDIAQSKRDEFVESGGKFEGTAPSGEFMEDVIDNYPLPKRLKSITRSQYKHNSRNVYVGPLKTRHFDDDSASLKHIYEQERMSSVDDQMKMYFAAASTSQESLMDECDADVSGNIEKKMNSYPSRERDIMKAIQDHKRLSASLKRCCFCWDQPAMLKHTVIAKGENVYLCAPPYKSLVEGHCFIVPISHVPSTLHMDENEYSEIQGFKRGLVKMASDQGQCMAFMETSYRHKSCPHAAIECIPMPRETGDLAPLYFKKAIDESEHEWAQNKKLIDLSKKNVRQSVPKDLPFFSVEFGLKGGFAHIIEDERQFPHYFGKEIIGGMLEIDSHNIVKQKEETTKEICQKVLKLVKVWWSKYKDYV